MHLPHFIIDLAVILAVAAVVSLIFHRLKLPVVLGYLVAGIFVGPYVPQFFTVVDLNSIKIWAELGVIIFMFTLGLEFSFTRLRQIGPLALTAGLIEIGCMILLGFIAGELLNFRPLTSLFLGAMIAISSTTIIFKTFEELRINNQRFTEIVIGILIVEDLAAILLLVALTNFATAQSLHGLDLIYVLLKLLAVIALWVVAGKFIVPRVIRFAEKTGSNEILTIISLGLCLGMVGLGAWFNYSPALAAFIMGSLIAECRPHKRIADAMAPLRYFFGAVFFVSVGMLFDPGLVIDNIPLVLMLTSLVVFGKIFFVTVGNLIAGQSLKNAVSAGFSMGQIGEFSFIIAAVGIQFKAIPDMLYPTVVATSILTTFLTPYAIKLSPWVVQKLQQNVPRSLLNVIDYYGHFTQNSFFGKEQWRLFIKENLIWVLNILAMVAVFSIAREYLLPFLSERVANQTLSGVFTWLAGLVFSTPFIVRLVSGISSVITSVQDPPQYSNSFSNRILVFLRLVVVLIVLWLLTLDFINILASTIVIGFFAVFAVFYSRSRLVDLYVKVSYNIKSQLQSSASGGHANIQKLAPWNARLIEFQVPSAEAINGKSLLDLKWRERFRLNIVAIHRGDVDIIAPGPQQTLYPHDRIVCFATDDEINKFTNFLHEVGQAEKDMALRGGQDQPFSLYRIEVEAGSAVEGLSLRASNIRPQFRCMVVGIEREGKRIFSPTSESVLFTGDIVWIVALENEFPILKAMFDAKAS